MKFPTHVIAGILINHEIRIPFNKPGFQWKVSGRFFFSWRNGLGPGSLTACPKEHSSNRSPEGKENHLSSNLSIEQ